MQKTESIKLSGLVDWEIVYNPDTPSYAHSIVLGIDDLERGVSFSILGGSDPAVVIDQLNQFEEELSEVRKCVFRFVKVERERLAAEEAVNASDH
jgi:uncharacterized protein (DUF2249 family)